MKIPIKMMVVPSTTGRGLTLRCVFDGAPTKVHDLRQALAAAGYEAGDAVELVPAGKAEALEARIAALESKLVLLADEGEDTCGFRQGLIDDARALLAKGGAE